MSDCNEAASQRLTGGLINPLATFREALPTTTSPETPAPYFKEAPLSEKEEKTNKAAGNAYITKTEKRESGAVEHNLRALSSGTVRCRVIDYLPAFLLLLSLILFVTWPADRTRGLQPLYGAWFVVAYIRTSNVMLVFYELSELRNSQSNFRVSSVLRETAPCSGPSRGGSSASAANRTGDGHSGDSVTKAGIDDDFPDASSELPIVQLLRFSTTNHWQETRERAE